ncbi:MAG TPA: glutaredoxin domain-containing protein, partial [Candidatus Polarisedimenticolia bacterium]|nr:glutaredoxin domain-containing protein [Candidatus Polarisedimenticolia bacterium]
TEYDVGGDFEGRVKMTERAGGRTSVPQIFIDGRHVGGCDDLYDLDRAGKLAPLLQGAS